MSILIRCNYCFSKTKEAKSSVARCTHVEVNGCEREYFSKTSAIFLYSLIFDDSSCWSIRFFDDSNLIESWLRNWIIANSSSQILFIATLSSFFIIPDACKVGCIVSCPLFERRRVHLNCSCNCNQSASEG